MFKLTKLVTFRPGTSATERQRVEAALDEAAGSSEQVLRARLRPTEPGAVNGGDLVWHVQFAGEAAYQAFTRQAGWRAVDEALTSSAVSHVDSAAYQQGTLGLRDPAIRNGVHRTLLFAIRPHTPAEKVARFEAEMREMPRYLPVIRNWNFSRVTEASGARPWTHVWEQEFEDAAGLNGPYMMHPIHFGSIDRWFDTQSHDWIVDPQLCHTLCAFADSMLAPIKRPG